MVYQTGAAGQAEKMVMTALAKPGQAWQGLAGFGQVMQNYPGQTMLCLFRHGLAELGKARLDQAMPGQAWLG